MPEYSHEQNLRLAQKMLDQQGQINDLTKERDGAYRERAHLVALLTAITDNAVITYAPDTDEPGWQIVYLTLGDRQCSWHISPRDADLFAHVERVGALDVRALWDGHTTEEKYAHIAAWTAELAEHGRACTDPAHVGYATTGECVHGPAQS